MMIRPLLPPALALSALAAATPVAADCDMAGPRDHIRSATTAWTDDLAILRPADARLGDP
jgi:hypothetical protein